MADNVRKLFQFSLVMLFLFGVVFLSFVDDANSSQPSAEAIKEQVELFKKKLSERGEQAEKETFDIHKASGLSKKMQLNKISLTILNNGIYQK